MKCKRNIQFFYKEQLSLLNQGFFTSSHDGQTESSPGGICNFESNDFKLEGGGKKEELGCGWDGRLAQLAGGSAP